MITSKDPKRHSVNENRNDLFLNKILKKKKLNLEMFNSFSKFMSPNVYKRYLQRYELYKLTKNIVGSIFECGVGGGGGLFNWILCKEILEPYNHTKKIVGFDTFSGFSSIHSKDKPKKIKNNNLKKMGLNYNNYEEIKNLVRNANKNSPLPHIEMYKCIKGDISKTLPKYLKENPETFISILYLDMDMYEPTLEALKSSYKNMSKGSIICFDEINHEFWPGESLAVKDFFDIKKIKINKFSFDSTAGYIII